MTRALVIFEESGTHALSWVLRQWKHVWCVVEDPDSGVWIGYNWLSGRVELSYLGTDRSEIMRHYSSLPGTEVVPIMVDTTPEPRFYWPLVLHSCVGMTKRTLRLNSWALTPGGLLRHLMGKERNMPLFDWLTLPGGGIFSSPKPRLPAPPPPPPTQVSAAMTSERRRQRQRAVAAQGAAGAVRNVGGGLGTPTTEATTATRSLLGN